ncbi:GNAT family N-acetyltransferase [candidate division KSB1 bacterium]|nr:MAG: GNAT family N-acetyltransferase [candidate division KSB1 bacterium]
MNVTTARSEDLNDLLALVVEYQENDETVQPADDALNLDYLNTFLEDNRQGTILIGRTSSGHAIGFITVYCRPSTLHAGRIAQVLDLFIREEYREQGFGRQLFQHAVRWAKVNKLASLHWFIGSMNMPAQYLSDSLEGAAQSGWLGYWLDLKDAK